MSVTGFGKGKGWAKLYCLKGHYKTSATVYGKHKDCLPCMRKRTREWFQKHHKRLNPIEWQNMFEQQNGRCLICGKHQSQLKCRLVVDHDHKNNRVRGLLCMACNLLLGNANDDSSVLQRALVYLAKFSEVYSH